MVLVLDRIDIRAARKDESLVNDFFEQNKGLARSVAFKYTNTGVERDELISLAYFGMVKAFNTFNIDSTTSFSTYAVPVMHNEILMELRKISVKNRLQKTQSLDFAVKKGIGEENDLKLEDIIEIPEDGFKTEDFDALYDVIDVFKLRFQNEPRLIKILHMYIVERKSTRDIAKEFGVCQPQGSKLAKKAIKEFQKIAIEMDIIDGFNEFYKRAKSGNIRKEKEKENAMKAKILYIIENYPELKSNEVGQIVGTNAQVVGIMISKIEKGKKINLTPDPSVKELVEKYIARMTQY